MMPRVGSELGRACHHLLVTTILDGKAHYRAIARSEEHILIHTITKIKQPLPCR